jgi:hypothetical protein
LCFIIGWSYYEVMNTTLSSEFLFVDGSEEIETSPTLVKTDHPAVEQLGISVIGKNVEITAGGCPNQAGCAKTGCTGACGGHATDLLS